MATRLEKIQRDFIWEGGALVNKPHLLSWSIVCLEKSKGGLGFRNLPTFNNGPLGKWSWRYAKKSSLKMGNCWQVWARRWGLVHERGEREG